LPYRHAPAATGAGARIRLCGASQNREPDPEANRYLVTHPAVRPDDGDGLVELPAFLQEMINTATSVATRRSAGLLPGQLTQPGLLG
jgi:hypothetical protein